MVQKIEKVFGMYLYFLKFCIFIFYTVFYFILLLLHVCHESLCCL